MTLRILKYFDHLSSLSSLSATSESIAEDDHPRVNAVEICLTAEEIPAQLQTVINICINQFACFFHVAYNPQDLSVSYTYIKKRQI